MTDALLAICARYGLWVQYYRGVWLVAMGKDIVASGASLPEAVERWCQEVERRKLVPAS